MTQRHRLAQLLARLMLPLRMELQLALLLLLPPLLLVRWALALRTMQLHLHWQAAWLMPAAGVQEDSCCWVALP